MFHSCPMFTDKLIVLWYFLSTDNLALRTGKRLTSQQGLMNRPNKYTSLQRTGLEMAERIDDSQHLVKCSVVVLPPSR